MSLALSLDPCTGLNLAGDHYRPGDFSVSAVVDGYLCSVFADQAGYNTNCFIKHANGGGCDLAVDGRVYLGVFVWNGQSFVLGGYLEEVEYTYTFDSTPLSFRALGVRPASYTGGVKIEGLYTSNQWVNHWTDGHGGEIWYSAVQPFVFSGRRQYVTNYRAEGWHAMPSGSGPAFTAHLGAIVADDVRWDVQHYARSAPFLRSASARAGNSSFHPEAVAR